MIMSVGPSSQPLGRQHLYASSVKGLLLIFCIITLVGPSVAVVLHCTGDVLLVHGSPLGNTHPPPLYGALCTHDSGLCKIVIPGLK